MSSTTEHVLAILKDQILCGELAMGASVREVRVARQLSVGRTPAREAIKRLVAEGWLEAAPNRGARVTSWGDAEVDEVFELRAVLEPAIVRGAIGRLTNADFEHLRDLANQMDCLVRDSSGGARNRITQLNYEFHGVISNAFGRTNAAVLVRNVVRLAIPARTFQQYSIDELKRSMIQHRQLLDALRTGDADLAAAVMKVHVLTARVVHQREVVIDAETELLAPRV